MSAKRAVNYSDLPCAKKSHVADDDELQGAYASLFQTNPFDVAPETFQEMISSSQEEIQALPSEKPSALPDTKTPFGYHALGEEIFFGAAVFMNRVKIHIRLFRKNAECVLVPTKIGITMSLETLFLFCNSVYKFDHKQPSQSFCVENTLFLSTNHDASCVTIQNIFKNKQQILQLSVSNIVLTCFQFRELLKVCNDVLKTAKHLLFSEIVKKIVLDNIKTNQHVDPHLACRLLQKELVSLVKKEVYEVLDSMVFPCDGCDNGYANQLGHECLEVSKFCKLFDRAITRLNGFNLANKFIKETQHLGQEAHEFFFKGLNVTDLFKDCKKDED